MSFDFFGEGIKKQIAIEYTKQQNDFFAGKLNFLDAQKSSVIKIGNCLQLLKYSGLKSDAIQKILKNLKLQSKKTFSYDEMKKVFRGVALVQNNKDPSLININANIKTKMPKFDDDDDDEDFSEEESDHTKVEKAVEIKQQPPQQPKVINQQVIQKPQVNPNIPTNQVNQNIKMQQNMSQQQALLNKLKDYDMYWGKLKTVQNRIDGTEVKKLCGHMTAKQTLSKSWKVCNLQANSALTKGQFYVFLQIITSGNVPEALTAEMKNMIAYIDKAPTHVEKAPTHVEKAPASTEKAPTQQVNHSQPISQQIRNKSSSQSQLSASQLFQNFGKNQSHVEKHPPAIQSISPAINTLKQKIQTSENNYNASHSQVQEESAQLRRNQQIMGNMMGEVQQFLILVNNKNGQLRQQIDELKNNQNSLNGRLNNVCLNMKNIIVRQNQYIEELCQELASQNNLNNQRVTVLEGYVDQVNAENQHKMQSKINHSQRRRSSGSSVDQSQSNPFHHEKEGEQEEEKRQSLKRELQKRQFQQRQSEKRQSEKNIVQQQQLYQQQQYQKQQQYLQQQYQQQQSEQQQNRNSQASEVSEAERQEFQREQIQNQNRMKMKQMQVIQLIHFLTPISPQEYPAIAQKITSCTEENLNVVYAGLYQRLQAKQKAEQEQNHHESPNKSRFPDQDEFNTSNFIAEDGQNKLQHKKNDFFH